MILAEAIAQRCGLDLNLVEFDSSGQIISHATDGSWSLSFVPIDDERRRRVGVGPAYYAGVSTYLVRAGMGLANVADVDSPSVRVVGVEGTATLRSAVRSLTNIVPRSVVALDEAVALFVAREVDAIALGRESIQSLLGTVEGAAMVSGHFHKAETAVIVPRGRPAALAATERLMKTLKEDGTIDAALSAYGLAP
ncbi:polar amino acid transport system substrate-binding protein [Angulomicrobium amanitiforme]|uniref:Polar amino acid transport system substrate-binding protein n=1 Tax=Ancylobacter amanitiformis TaxID=217069 RepID=A0ABU0LW93_9HYPH|nr:polar amino acid transport system substrate-binding protein [Ancylobacter amanitiformis]